MYPTQALLELDGRDHTSLNAHRSKDWRDRPTSQTGLRDLKKKLCNKHRLPHKAQRFIANQ